MRTALLLPILLIITLPTKGEDPSPLLKEVTFETGDLTQMGLHVAREDAITLVSSPVRSGRFAAKTTLRVTDPKVHKGQRAEMTDGKELPAIEMNRDYWYGLSIYLPDTFQSPTDTDAVLFQWHTLQGGPSPVLAIRIRRDEWLITSDATPDKRRKLAFLPLEREQWTDWVVHVRWSSEKDGFWTIWKNGTEVVSEKNIITQYPEARGPYVKFGQYHSVDKHTPENTVYFDEYRVAGPNGNYQQVAPRN